MPMMNSERMKAITTTYQGCPPKLRPANRGRFTKKFRTRVTKGVIETKRIGTPWPMRKRTPLMKRIAITNATTRQSSSSTGMKKP